MNKITLLGMDIAKNKFQLHGVNEAERSKWAIEVKKRAGYNKASVALANKTARICWALVANNTVYERAAV